MAANETAEKQVWILNHGPISELYSQKLAVVRQRNRYYNDLHKINDRLYIEVWLDIVLL